jgi:hypothetical protein
MTPLTQEQMAALEQLRDIRLPGAIGLWPLAPGWWALLALLTLTTLAAIAFATLRRRTRRYIATRELERLRERSASEPASDVAIELAALIRRVALSTSDQSVGRLSDADWAQVLSSGKAGFPAEIAAFLTEAPYSRPENVTADCLAALFRPAETWIRRTA